VTAVVVMGVTGSGKSTVAARLAARLGWELAEADDFHSAANVAKMRAGTPLTDADRWPWLEALADWIAARRAAGRDCVVACSALKRVYRDRLARGHDDVRFVYLRGDRETIAGRLAQRTGHYMPASLLDSQLEALEEPHRDERALVVDIGAAPDALVDSIVATLLNSTKPDPPA
jgi:gluconokinase